MPLAAEQYLLDLSKDFHSAISCNVLEGTLSPSMSRNFPSLPYKLLYMYPGLAFQHFLMEGNKPIL